MITTVVLQYLVVPSATGIIVWSVTSRRKDNATTHQLIAQTRTAEAQGTVSERTVNAAVQLADVGLLREQITAMNDAFTHERQSRTEERESLTERLQEAEHRLSVAMRTIEELQDTQDHYQREILDLYRRDRYYQQQLQEISNWIYENLPRLRRIDPQIADPPRIRFLPPLLAPVDSPTAYPARRWYDGYSEGNENDEQPSPANS